MAHTPTPWPEFVDFEFQSDPIAIVQPETASENGGFKIAIFHGPDRVANAALVIAAVNSYASSQAEIARLRKALEPFAEAADVFAREYPAMLEKPGTSCGIRFDALQAARAALEPKP